MDLIPDDGGDSNLPIIITSTTLRWWRRIYNKEIKNPNGGYDKTIDDEGDRSIEDDR